MIAPPHFDFHQMGQKGQSASRPSKMLYLFAVLLNFGGKFNLYFIQISGHQEYRNYSNLVLLSLPLTHVFRDFTFQIVFFVLTFNIGYNITIQSGIAIVLSMRHFQYSVKTNHALAYRFFRDVIQHLP